MPLMIRQAVAAGDRLEHRCAICGKQSELRLDDLVLGVSLGDRMNPDGIALPPCACGARETLIRNWDSAPDENQSQFAEHRRFVNTIAIHLKACGKTHPDCKGLHEAEKGPPPDCHPCRERGPKK